MNLTELSSEKSAHKLLIKLELRARLSEQRRRVLARNETVRGVATDVVIKITNLAKSSFGGGVVRELSVQNIALNIPYRWTSQSLIPLLNPDDNTEIKKTIIPPPFDGPSWLGLIMTSNDGLPINTYRSADAEKPGTNEWYEIIYVINREMFNIYSVLRRIEKKGNLERGQSTL